MTDCTYSEDDDNDAHHVLTDAELSALMTMIMAAIDKPGNCLTCCSGLLASSLIATAAVNVDDDPTQAARHLLMAVVSSALEMVDGHTGVEAERPPRLHS